MLVLCELNKRGDIHIGKPKHNEWLVNTFFLWKSDPRATELRINFQEDFVQLVVDAIHVAGHTTDILTSKADNDLSNPCVYLSSSLTLKVTINGELNMSKRTENRNHILICFKLIDREALAREAEQAFASSRSSLASVTDFCKRTVTPPQWL